MWKGREDEGERKKGVFFFYSPEVATVQEIAATSSGFLEGKAPEDLCLAGGEAEVAVGFGEVPQALAEGVDRGGVGGIGSAGNDHPGVLAGGDLRGDGVHGGEEVGDEGRAGGGGGGVVAAYERRLGGSRIGERRGDEGGGRHQQQRQEQKGGSFLASLRQKSHRRSDRRAQRAGAGGVLSVKPTDRRFIGTGKEFFS